MVYYRGNFESDIEMCTPRKSGTNAGGAPHYQYILRTIWKTALALAEQNKIILREEVRIIKIPKRGNVRVTAHIATGA